MTVAIVTDSSCCLPQHLIREHNIIVVPISYEIDGDIFRDGDLPASEFYTRLESAKRPPKTQTPAPGDFMTAYRSALESGATGVICVTLPESYSGTHRAAASAAAIAASEIPQLRITVIDSGGLAMVHGFAVLAAAEAVRAGADDVAIQARVAQRVTSAGLVGAVESTRYLARSGRVPVVFHWAASALHLRPVFAAEGTSTRSLGVARTVDLANEKMMAYITRITAPGAPLNVGIMHANAPDHAVRFTATLREHFNLGNVLMTEFTPVMGIHTGPGLVAVAFYEE
jgi:DegV family protein with EDD domain